METHTGGNKFFIFRKCDTMNTLVGVKFINPRLCIEETILRFNPNISDEDLLNMREEIYLKVFQETPPSYYTDSAQNFDYIRDYQLYTKR